jgi:hypothetical protein
MSVIAIVVVIALAVGVGLLANRRQPRMNLGDEALQSVMAYWVSPYEMVGRVATLAILLLAFSIVLAGTSFLGAGSGASSEATALGRMYELSDYVPEPQRERLKATAVCYARAVRRLEWEAMRDGESSAVVTGWTTRFREQFQQLARDKDPFLSMLLSANGERESARQQRLGESRPTIPSSIFWLLLAAAAVSIGWVAFLIPRMQRRRPFLVALGILAVFLTAALLLAHDLDRPFAGGVEEVEPKAIASTQVDMTRDFVDRYGSGRVGCNDTGKSTT